MLEQQLSAATLVFCYDLALEAEFLTLLNSHLTAQLPITALVLVRGQALPPCSQVQGKQLLPILQTNITNRMHQYYGYQVVEAAAGSSKQAAHLVLEEQKVRL